MKVWLAGESTVFEDRAGGAEMIICWELRKREKR